MAPAKCTARPYFPGPAARRSSSPGSGFPALNHRTSPKSGPQDSVSASATSAARDLCPGRKRKRAGPGAPTPCRGGPSRRARDFLQVHVHPGAGGPAPRARTCSAQPSGALRTAGGLGAARGRPGGAGPGHNGSPPADAGTARVLPLNGRSSGAARAPNAAAAAAWHRRAARPVHANGRRPRHELFSSGAERVSAARRAAWPARPPPLRSRHGDFPNFRRSAPRMRPPRLLRPRLSAPAALPRCRLFYVFCLGVGTCPRERVSLPTPSPPDRGGGGGTGDPERRGWRVGEARPLRAPQPGEIARGRRPCPRAQASLFCGEVRASAVPRIPTRPPGAPGRARSGRGQGAAPP